MPIYCMSMLQIPRSVRLRLEKIQRELGGEAFETKPHHVKWKIVCSGRSKSGCHMPLTLNKALLCKWSWSFVLESDSLWKVVINLKCGDEERGWYTRDVREWYGVGM